jgi:deoxyribonuclease-4
MELKGSSMEHGRALVIGPHISTAGGYKKAAENVAAMGANTFQFFSRNPRGSSFRPYDPKDTEEFQALRRMHHFGPVQAHMPYTVNLAGKNQTVYEFSKRVLKEDIGRMDEMHIEYLVLHPGSHLGLGIDEGLQKAVDALNEALCGNEKITVLLETMPGKGTEVGFRFEHLKRLMEGASCKDKLGICMDLCHLYSSGYDIKNSLDSVLEDMDRQIGLSMLKTVHLNDSRFPLGSRKDRHTPIGKGEIGLKAVIDLMKHPYIRNIPFYLETPLDHEGHRREIEMIKNALDG